MNISIKLKFRPSQIEGHEGALFFQIIFQRLSYQYTTNYKILPIEWDGRKSTIINPAKSYFRHDAIFKIRKRVRWELATLTRHANRLLDEDECTTVDEILESWKDIVRQQPFFTFMQSVVDKLQSINKHGTAEKYKSAMRSFEHFITCQDLMIFELNSELIEEYQRWLIENDVSMNTVSFYMRILRAVFNRAIRQKLISQSNPFANVYTGVAETRKRAVDLNNIQRIKSVDLHDNNNLEFARDLFLFAFYCRGMAFVDMAHLTKENISNGYLTYIRQKTNQEIVVRWEPQMQEIVDRYNTESKYLLPILKDDGTSEYKQYKRMNKNVCRWLKVVGERACISMNLTMYVARHSWTSIAKQRNHSLSTISKALGHTSEKTTQIYLASLDNSAIDDANSDILNELK